MATTTADSHPGDSLIARDGGNQSSLRIETTTSRIESGKARREIFCGKGLRMLVWLNISMFLFHSALVVVTLVLGNLSLSVPVYDLSYDLEVATNTTAETAAGGDEGGARGGGWKLVPKGGAVVMDLKFTWMTASFFAISALFHFGNAVLWRRHYLNGIASAQCPSR